MEFRQFFAAQNLALLLALAAFNASAQAPVKMPVDREQLERKLVSTSTLIESSSAARQIQGSGIEAAATQRARARELHAKAGVALKAGQLESATTLLDDASRAMFEAVRLADSNELVARKQKTDFDARLESTRVLLDAQKRIAAEKGGGPRAGDLAQKVELEMRDAQQLAGAGRLADARIKLDGAYLAVKAAIGNLRNGETVVRSLNFASKAEEYIYEIDRNDTHKMLVTMLLKDKRGTASVDAMVDEAVNAAGKLRVQAEEQAARRDHDGAVKTLENSTRELVKAIRAAGVYIPG
jgi:hypothetical protein